ncbi:DUF3054 domain-containing protein [Flaviflexus huanghaiensis]|uniref:DUF3054 domain-containing protein n=1 Tax=Flaviflexus huanghaiensis TaxID=1111473 RepID=UPI0015F812DB|nr:DUF3054 domain-containing protein [Flaviflexus huanghaiensis]
MRAFLLDLVLTAGFVALGMASHGSPPAEYPLTALPFIIALVGAWALPRVSRDPASLVSGAIVWSVTTIGGLGLRALFGDGLAGAFTLVTASVLAVFFFGWRAIAAFRSSRSPR